MREQRGGGAAEPPRRHAAVCPEGRPAVGCRAGHRGGPRLPSPRQENRRTGGRGAGAGTEADLVGPREDTDLDALIHRTIYRLTRNPHLESTLNQYLNLGMRIWYHCLDRLPDVGPHVAVQQEVLGAIIAGDAELAGTVASRHIHRFSEHVRDCL